MGRSRRKDVSCEGDGLADEADRDVESNRGVREAVNRRQLALLSVERTFMREEWHAFLNAAGLQFHVPTVMFDRRRTLPKSLACIEQYRTRFIRITEKQWYPQTPLAFVVSSVSPRE
jgi:hypothetical protein